MKVLVIGSGGREHAICKKIAKSNQVEKIYCIPGNVGTSALGTNVEIDMDAFDEIVEFVQENGIDLTVVGPELPLVNGLVDRFQEEGLRIFGPDKKSAQLEGSKKFSKDFLVKYQIPTAAYDSYRDFHEASNQLSRYDYPMVIKADGLCAGKGVIICENPLAAVYTLKDILVESKFGDQGQTVVIEEFLQGYEASVFCMVSHGKLFLMDSAKDFKKIGEKDTGLNTGGVGAYSPNLLLDEKNKKIIEEEIIPQIEAGLISEGLLFNGILFIGFMITESGPKVLEFNVRFGDPETQVLLPRLESDLVDIMTKSIDNTLRQEDIKFSEKVTMTVILTSKGYPETYKTGYAIEGLDQIEAVNGLEVVHNGTKKIDNVVYNDGGRVLSIIAMADTLIKCKEKIYDNIDKVHFDNMQYRKDIG